MIHLKESGSKMNEFLLVFLVIAMLFLIGKIHSLKRLIELSQSEQSRINSILLNGLKSIKDFNASVEGPIKRLENQKIAN